MDRWRVVEGVSLEKLSTRKGIASSNLALPPLLFQFDGLRARRRPPTGGEFPLDPPGRAVDGEFDRGPAARLRAGLVPGSTTRITV